MTARSHNLDTTKDERIALFTGTFDPFTIGHASIVERALPLFDRIVIAVGSNAGKTGVTPVEVRCQAIRELYQEYSDRISVEPYSDELTIDAARRLGAKWILRGIRSVKDFEYERDMADINRRLSGIETILMFTMPEHSAISSSVVRELNAYGQDITQFLPQNKNK